MQHAHHLVILVGQDVAVPHIAAWLIKGCLDAGDLTRQRRDHVLGCILNIFCWLRYNRSCFMPHDLETCAIGGWIPHNGIVLYGWLGDQICAIVSRCVV